MCGNEFQFGDLWLIVIVASLCVTSRHVEGGGGGGGRKDENNEVWKAWWKRCYEEVREAKRRMVDKIRGGEREKYRRLKR